MRCFEDQNIVHVDGKIDPLRDIETINLELILADIETIDKKIEKAKKMLKADKKYAFEIEVLEKTKKVLESGKSARTIEYTDEEKEIIKDAYLLTIKPILYIANISEEQITKADEDKNVNKVKEYAKQENASVIPLCVKIEEELSSLERRRQKRNARSNGTKRIRTRQSNKSEL